LKISSGSLPDYSFEMHHKDPTAPGHQPSSDGLLPAFNGNTKPLKYRALDQLLRIGIPSDARHGPRRPTGRDCRATRKTEALTSGLWSIQGSVVTRNILCRNSHGSLAADGLKGVANSLERAAFWHKCLISQ
jgi:hypothetical protein